jgi:hypothetical protein
LPFGGGGGPSIWGGGMDLGGADGVTGVGTSLFFYLLRGQRRPLHLDTF